MPEDDPRPLPPEPPDDDACCGNGCEPCVYDLYDQERERWRVALREWKERQKARDLGVARVQPGS